MTGNFDFETYDKIVRENKEEAKDDMEKALKVFRQKEAAYKQACESEEVWLTIRAEYGGKQSGTIEEAN